MSDGWTDIRGWSLMNFLVNCPAGTMFVKSIDASAYIKTGDKMFELLDSFVEHVGEANVVQVITDNASNFVMAGKLLQAKRPHLYWTPCGAHCIDLMLEDIGKIPQVSTTLERAIGITGFIYNHTGVLNMMRDFTKHRELIRAGQTSFCTSYLTLQCIHKQKVNLRTMFTSQEWVSSKWAKTPKGKRVSETIIMPSFWNSVVYTLKVMGPLVRVLRLVDNEKKPAMGYIYEAMDRAKEAIMKAFNENEEKYKDVFKIIDTRWECQLHHPLHAAGHYLNPEFFYENPRLEFDEEVISGLYACISRLVPRQEVQDKIMSELYTYKKAEGLFGIPLAVRSRKTKAPAEWWSLYGCSTPNLQQLAIKILSLTCSSSGCERNWSVFQQIHTKRRNRLAQKRLNDLVYVKYNQKLKARYDRRNVIDPISLEDIDKSNEWLIGKMGMHSSLDAEDDLVFVDDDLTWDAVASAAGVGEGWKNTRLQAKSRSVASTSQSNFEEEEADSEESEEEDVRDYQSGGYGSEENIELDSDNDF